MGYINGIYWPPGPWLNIKMPSYQYRKSHCGDKMVLRLSYLHNGISYTDKTTSLYWIIAQGQFQIIDNTSYCTISKPQDLYLELCDCLEIALKFETPRQQCCRGVCQISKRCDDLNYQSRDFRDFMRSYDKTSYRILKQGPGSYWARATILVPCHVVKSLKLVWRSDNDRLNLWVLHFQINNSDVTSR